LRYVVGLMMLAFLGGGLALLVAATRALGLPSGAGRISSA
jgi:hypothetical protein